MGDATRASNNENWIAKIAVVSPALRRGASVATAARQRNECALTTKLRELAMSTPRAQRNATFNNNNNDDAINVDCTIAK